MKIPYKQINKALSAEMNGVKLIPDPQGIRVFVLRFENNVVTQEEMEQATAIVNRFVRSEWFFDEIRNVE
jgi:hypothetical protein